MRQLTTIAALVVALVTPAAARSRLVVLDRPTLACSDQQALETALTLARLHDGPGSRQVVRLHVDRPRRRPARGGGRVGVGERSGDGAWRWSFLDSAIGPAGPSPRPTNGRLCAGRAGGGSQNPRGLKEVAGLSSAGGGPFRGGPLRGRARPLEAVAAIDIGVGHTHGASFIRAGTGFPRLPLRSGCDRVDVWVDIGLGIRRHHPDS